MGLKLLSFSGRNLKFHCKTATESSKKEWIKINVCQDPYIYLYEHMIKMFICSTKNLTECAMKHAAKHLLVVDSVITGDKMRDSGSER